MSSKRYVLYVDQAKDARIITGCQNSFVQQVHIQHLSRLENVPQWLASVPRPVLADTMKLQGYYEEELQKFLATKKIKTTKFGSVDEDE